MQVPADAGGVVPSSQRVLQALDQVTEVVEGLKDLRTLVQHRQVHHWFILDDRQKVSLCNLQQIKRHNMEKFRCHYSTNLCPEWGVWIHEQKTIFLLQQNDNIFLISTIVSFWIAHNSIFELLSALLDEMNLAIITWLTNDRGTPGRPWKEKELFRQWIIQLQSDTIVWPRKVEDLLEVQGVHEVQEIPNEMKNIHTKWGYMLSIKCPQ